MKRLQRIVDQNMKKTDECLVQEGQSSRTSLIIKDSRTRYSKKCDPDQRKLTKFEQCPNLNDSSPSGSVDEQHYDRYTESNNSDNTSDTPLTSTARNIRQPKTTHIQRTPMKKNKQSTAGKLRNEANKKHEQMCTKALNVMDKLDKVLNTFKISDDDTE